MTKKINKNKEDQKIVYKCDDNGNLLQDPIKCVMCKKQIAFFIAKETDEPLCRKCYEINANIRLW